MCWWCTSRAQSLHASAAIKQSRGPQDTPSQCSHSPAHLGIAPPHLGSGCPSIPQIHPFLLKDLEVFLNLSDDNLPTNNPILHGVEQVHELLLVVFPFFFPLGLGSLTLWSSWVSFDIILFEQRNYPTSVDSFDTITTRLYPTLCRAALGAKFTLSCP